MASKEDDCLGGLVPVELARVKGVGATGAADTAGKVYIDLGAGAAFSSALSARALAFSVETFFLTASVA